MPKAGTRNVLYVLENGSPDEWALARDVTEGTYPAGVRLHRFENVPDDLADEIESSGKPKHFWQELEQLPHETL